MAKLIFKSIDIHNFMSFTDTTVNLNVPGYILVFGENNNTADNSSSNGSGKSSIFEAILFALTGEVQRGVNPKALIKQDSKECSVKLTLDIDKDSYTITRSLNPAQSLNIIRNGADISGKGIRDSEKLLNEYLPDINMQMLSNIVILGQGLPGRLSAQTPSGRKEVLEKLFKADFMIDDIKSRIADRLSDLKTTQREYEDSILTLNTKKNIAEESIDKALAELEAMEDVSNLKTTEKDLTAKISAVEADIKVIKEFNTKILAENEGINKEILGLTQKKVAVTNSDYLIHDIDSVKDQGISLKSEVLALEKDIEAKDNITDICPTCGQKLIGVEKPDTTKDKKKLASMNEKLDELRAKMKSLQSDRKSKIDSDIEDIDSAISKLQKSLQQTVDISSKELELSKATRDLADITTAINSYNSRKAELISNIDNNKKIVANADVDISNISTEKLKLEAKIEIDNKINSIIKRDFRGYLLSNIIALLDNTIKQYAITLFGHTNINISQDGNNISIKLNNKEYEVLSSGEKQKVDILLQIAMRDVLCKYLGLTSNILVCDELFDTLDYGSVEKVISILTNEIKVQSMFIVTHRQDLDIPVDSRIKIRKTDSGSIAIQV